MVVSRTKQFRETEQLANKTRGCPKAEEKQRQLAPPKLLVLLNAVKQVGADKALAIVDRVLGSS